MSVKYTAVDLAELQKAKEDWWPKPGETWLDSSNKPVEVLAVSVDVHVAEWVISYCDKAGKSWTQTLRSWLAAFTEAP